MGGKRRKKATSSRGGVASRDRRARGAALPAGPGVSLDPVEVSRLAGELLVHREELDIQNRQLVESQRLLEESRDRYATLYDVAPVPYVTLCHNGVIREINLTGADLLGQPRARLLERPFLLFVAADDRRAFLSHMSKVRKARAPLSTEVAIRTHSGRLVPVELRSSEAVLDGGTTGTHHLFAIIDLTERRRAEAERDRLRTSGEADRLLGAVLKALPVAARVVETNGQTLFANEACRTLWGAPPDAPLPPWDQQKGWEPATGRRLLACDWPIARALRSSRPLLRQMIHLQGFDGATRVVMQSAVPLVDEAGQVTGAVEVSEDVTPLVTAQESARHRKAQLEAAFDAAHLGFWDWDLTTDRVAWAGPFGELFTAGTDDAASSALGEFYRHVHPDDLERVRQAVEEARQRRAPFEQEYRVVYPGGQTRWLSSTGRFAYRAGGQPTRMAGVITDVTARKVAEEAVLRAKQDAEAASRLKDDFLATVSHELRTPLSAIILWAHLARSTMKDGSERDAALETILQNAKAQSQIVEDLLDVSRVIAGKLRLDLRPASLGAAVRAALDSVRPSADAKQVRVVDETGGDLPAVPIDPDRMQQVAWNLLTNAIKFTPAGGTVRVTLAMCGPDVPGEDGAAPRARCVRLSVTDTGKGIDPAFLPQMFDRFRQAESGTTRSYGGLGLGLAITRELVQMHGGTVRATSEGIGRGATFTVDLPLPVELPASAAPSPAATARRKLSGLRVLLVEDEPDTRAALAKLLGAAGARVRAVGAADEALDAFRAARPDVLVSDIAMPGGDGYDLLRRVREIEGTGAAAVIPRNGPRPVGQWRHSHHTPAVALTARARAEDRAATLAAGYDAHLPKPADPEQLISTLAELCYGRRIPSRHPRRRNLGGATSGRRKPS